MLWMTVIAVIGAVVLWALWPRQTFTQSQRVDRLSRKFRELLDGSPKPSILILEARRNGPFVQFAHHSTLYANFPLITEPNRKLESRFRSVLSERGLPIRIQTGSDGAHFLEVELPVEADHAADFAQLVLRAVFDLKPNSRVKTKLLF